MNRNQTDPRPCAAVEPTPSAPTDLPPLNPVAQAVLDDWDDPSLSEADLARRHHLSIETLFHISQTPAFRSALAVRRHIRADRTACMLERVMHQAVQVLSALSVRSPDSNAAAKEIRLATQDLLRLRASGPDTDDAMPPPPPQRPRSDARRADAQPARGASPSPIVSPIGAASGQAPEQGDATGANQVA